MPFELLNPVGQIRRKWHGIYVIAQFKLIWVPFQERTAINKFKEQGVICTMSLVSHLQTPMGKIGDTTWNIKLIQNLLENNMRRMIYGYAVKTPVKPDGKVRRK